MKVISGNWVLPNGSPVANGTLYLQLNQAGLSAQSLLTASGSTYATVQTGFTHGMFIYTTTITITTTTNHGLVPGAFFSTSGFSPGFINVSGLQVLAVPSPTTFTYAFQTIGTNNGNGSGSGGTVAPLAVAAQVAPKLIAVSLDVNGSVPANTAIIANDELTPAGTFYRVTVEQAGGGRVYGPDSFSITGVSPINLNNLVPSV